MYNNRNLSHSLTITIFSALCLPLKTPHHSHKKHPAVQQIELNKNDEETFKTGTQNLFILNFRASFRFFYSASLLFYIAADNQVNMSFYLTATHQCRKYIKINGL